MNIEKVAAYHLIEVNDYGFKYRKKSFYDVTQFPPELLQAVDGDVQVPVTYKKIWDDGFGARGWKLDATIGDPEIIASTRETGQRINTSVFIHDILDHFLSDFGVSGQRREAMALIQLSKRTGSDPVSDYEQYNIDFKAACNIKRSVALRCTRVHQTVGPIAIRRGR
jgi:hypothetical protein